MAKWVMVVATNCADSSREAEFTEWYDKIHVPDILKTPGFVRANRYEAIEPSESEAKFLAVYEIEAEDIDEVKRELAKGREWRHAKRYSELLVVLSSRTYRQISSLSK